MLQRVFLFGEPSLTAMECFGRLFTTARGTAPGAAASRNSRRGCTTRYSAAAAMHTMLVPSRSFTSAILTAALRRRASSLLCPLPAALLPPRAGFTAPLPGRPPARPPTRPPARHARLQSRGDDALDILALDSLHITFEHEFGKTAHVLSSRALQLHHEVFALLLRLRRARWALEAPLATALDAVGVQASPPHSRLTFVARPRASLRHLSLPAVRALRAARDRC